MTTYAYPSITPNESMIELTSNTQLAISPFNGAIQSLDRGGERLTIKTVHRNLKDAERRSMGSFSTKIGGQTHRVSLRDHSYSGPSGTLSIIEMLDVTFNATNWNASNSARASTTDKSSGILVHVEATAASTNIAASTDGISAPTVGVSYAATISSTDSHSSSAGGAVPPIEFRFVDSGAARYNAPLAAAQTVGQRLVAVATAPSATELFPRLLFNTDSSGEFGGTVGLLNLSVARCLLVDNGFNALTKSQEFDHADWSKSSSTISADAATAPDGTTTADELIEDSTAASTHYAQHAYTRLSVAEFWTGSVHFESNTSQRIALRVDDGTSNYSLAYFDATLGTITLAAAEFGTSSLSYATIHDLGNGRYRARISTKIPASTTVRLTVYLCDGAANTISFNGDGTSGLYIWGAQLQRGGQLGRYTATTTAAITGTDQTGKEIWLKGLDASVNGQLLEGDQIEINGQLLILDDDLDGDASGIGLARVSPRIRNAPADENPAILYQPHGTFLLSGPNVSRVNKPGGFSDFSFSFVEDIAA